MCFDIQFKWVYKGMSLIMIVVTAKEISFIILIFPPNLSIYSIAL